MCTPAVSIAGGAPRRAARSSAAASADLDQVVRRTRLPALVCWSSLIAVLLPGCSCPDAEAETRAQSPAVLLPGDEAPHCYAAEWWYYTGLLNADDARAFGFEAVIFHAAPGWLIATPQGLPIAVPVDGYVAHIAVTDVADGAFHFDQTRTVQSQPRTDNGFHLTTPILTLRGSGGLDHLSAVFADGRYRLDLDLSTARAPVLHGGRGYVHYGSAGSAFYYSRPQMAASGTLLDGTELLNVEGTAWFDRQWGDDIRNPFLKWMWFSLRLDNGAAVMLYRFFDGEDPTQHGTLIEPAGAAVALAAEDFEIRETVHWTSPVTRAVYPVRWQVRILPADMRCDVNRVLDDQELDVRATTANVYWEGLCRVSGTRGGVPLAGHAFVEMANFHLP